MILGERAVDIAQKIEDNRLKLRRNVVDCDGFLSIGRRPRSRTRRPRPALLLRGAFTTFKT